MVSTSDTNTLVNTKELILTYSDIVNLFFSQGKSVSDPNQTFNIAVRKTIVGGSQDNVIGSTSSMDTFVIQYTTVTNDINSTPTQTIYTRIGPAEGWWG